MNKSGKLHIELNSLDGTFQGYVSHVSVAKQKVATVPNKYQALSFSNEVTAYKVCRKIHNITRGCLVCTIR